MTAGSRAERNARIVAVKPGALRLAALSNTGGLARQPDELPATLAAGRVGLGVGPEGNHRVMTCPNPSALASALGPLFHSPPAPEAA